MKHQLFALKDQALDAFQRPFYATTVNHAKRMFIDLMNNKDAEAARHPADFALYHLGEFDDHNGQTTNENAPTMLLRGTDAKKVSDKERGE